MIYLRKIEIDQNNDRSDFPFNIPLFKNGFNLEFKNDITIIIGENGSGKSTILKYIANNIGFNLDGGNVNNTYDNYTKIPPVEGFRCIWNRTTKNGFYFKSDTFDNYYKYLEMDPFIARGYHKHYSKLSHGESFLELFKKFQNGIFLLDEPESALSPQNQLALLKLIHDLIETKQSQIIILTHSPILITYPEADLYEIKQNEIKKVDYHETEHYYITKQMLNSPAAIYKYLFEEE